MNLIDTHCHLNMPPLSEDVTAVLQRAGDRGVTRLITPAYDLASWPDVLDLAAQHRTFPALGLHPWVADQLPAGGQLKTHLAEAITKSSVPVVAIGEIGLDTKVESPALEVQLAVLETQLELAVDLDLPVILHCRGAFHELLAAVKHHGGQLRGVIHAWTRGPELVQSFHATGLHFGLGGGVTRENARKIRRGAKVIPMNRIVLETDAPSIGLQGFRPEETEPRHVADVALALATLREENPETIARESTNNAVALFGLPAV